MLFRSTAHTGGAITYPPTIADGRVHVGSGDGRAWCFELATGRTLWCFRAAPLERRIPVYGRLLSTWPVASGVMVADGVAYCAAGIICHDGTHVYALDATTGKIRWQNNQSGNLLGEDESVGVSVQGHMLLHDGVVHLAGGNVVSPANYDLKPGKCLHQLSQNPATPPLVHTGSAVNATLRPKPARARAAREDASAEHAEHILSTRRDT